jgi:hypothetical protein
MSFKFFFKFYDFLTIIYLFILIFLIDILDLVFVNEEFYVAVFLLIYFVFLFYFLNRYVYVFLKNFYFLLNIFEFANFLKILNNELLKNLKYFFFEFLCWYHCFRSLLFRLCLVIFKLRRLKRRFFFFYNFYNFFHFFLLNIYYLNILKYFITFFLFNFYLKILENFKNYTYVIYFYKKYLIYFDDINNNTLSNKTTFVEKKFNNNESNKVNYYEIINSNLVSNLLNLINNSINLSCFFFNNINLKKKIKFSEEDEVASFSDFFIFFPYLIEYKGKYTHTLAHNFLENSLFVNFFFYVNKYNLSDNLKNFYTINKILIKEIPKQINYLLDSYTYFINYNKTKIVLSYYLGILNFNVNFDYNDIIFTYFKLTFFDIVLSREKQFALKSRLRFYFLNYSNFFDYDRKIFFSNFYYNELFDYKNYDLKEYFFFFLFKNIYLTSNKINIFPSLLIILRDLYINKY